MRQSNDRYVTISDVVCIKETDAALLIRLEDDTEHWIPLSQLSKDSDVSNEDDEGTITLTRWIAEQKSLEEYVDE